MSSRLTLIQKLRSTALVTACSVGAFCGVCIYKNNEKFYDEVLMPIVRQCPPEMCHRAAVIGFKYGLFPKQKFDDADVLKSRLFNRELNNPIGIAAGFDKHGEAVIGLADAGFGFVEIGSVTPEPQPGNPQPRVFRLVEDRAIINRYGFNSDGHEIVYERLKKLRDQHPNPRFTLGINLGKNKSSENAIPDYVHGVIRFGPIADYLVINISSPNTPGLRSLQNKDDLKSLLTSVFGARDFVKSSTSDTDIPIVLKLAPDLTDAELKDIVAVITSKQCRVDGIIVSNTTVERAASLKDDQKTETGGLSGAPLAERSTILIAKLYKMTKGQVPIIGVGGIFTGRDAFEKILAGATAVQLYTALIFGGPPVVQRVKRELGELLQENGFRTVREAVGTKADYYSKLNKTK